MKSISKCIVPPSPNLPSAANNRSYLKRARARQGGSVMSTHDDASKKQIDVQNKF